MIDIDQEYKKIKNSGLFDEKYYLSNYPDVKLAGVNPIIHYIKVGAKEKRNPSLLFNTTFYVETYSDIAASQMNPLTHYIVHGIKEGRLINEDGINHLSIREVKISKLFDESYYKNRYKNVISGKFDPITHYLIIGSKKGYNPSPTFDTDYYLRAYPEVSESKLNPFIHYIRKGKARKAKTYERKYFITLASMIGSEGKYLDEWLSYYIFQGVEHFYLSLEKSTEHLLNILQPYVEKGYVTIYKEFQNKENAKNNFFDEIIRTKDKEAEWCCFFDENEFFQGKDKLVDLINSFEETISGLELFNKVFTCLESETYNENYLIKNFHSDSKCLISATKSVKSICRLRKTKCENRVHAFDYFKGKIINAHFEDIAKIDWKKRTNEAPIILDGYWLNQYFCDSIEILEAIEEDAFSENKQKKWNDLMLISLEEVKKISLRINFEKICRDIKAAGLFDEAYYLSRNPDVKAAKVDSVAHYLTAGRFEGRNPAANFNTNFSSKQPSVEAFHEINSLINFFLKGKANPLALPKKKYFLALAACIKNKGKYLDEWLCYYIYQGVEHFYLNDEGSTDNTRSILQSYIDKGFVTVYSGLQQQGTAQSDFYDKIIREKDFEAEWCCFFDTSEFYEGNQRLDDFLFSLDETVSGVELFRKSYSDPYLKKVNPEFVIERFIQHGKLNSDASKYVKSICRLKQTKKAVSVYAFDYLRGKVINSKSEDISSIPLETRIKQSSPTWEKYWLNYYNCKTDEEHSFKKDNFQLMDQNLTKNESMQKYVKIIKEMMVNIKEGEELTLKIHQFLDEIPLSFKVPKAILKKKNDKRET